MSDNVLLHLGEEPRFDQIKTEDIKPALQTAIAEAREQIATIKAQTHTDWANTVEKLTDITERVGRIWSVVSHLNSVVDTPELRAVYNELMPEITIFFTEIGQDIELYNRFKIIKNSAEFNTLSPAQQTKLNHDLRDFVLSGAELPPEQQAELAQLQTEGAQLGAKFAQNVQDATDAFGIYFDDAAPLAGIPEDSIAMFAAAAQSEGKTGYKIGLQIPHYLAVIQYADNRELREQIYRAYVTRASELADEGKFDNTANVEQTLANALKTAKLLGFKNYAELSLATKMADTPEQVLNFLHDLARRAKPFAEKDFAEIKAFARENLNIEDPQSWDLSYAAEKLRQAKYAFSETEVKKYFPISKVLAGLFTQIKKLYGIELAEKTVPVWHKDVRYFELKQDGQTIGGVYMDLYAREGKRGGAWMDGYKSRRRFADGTLQLPTAYLVCNFTPPVGDKEARLSHDEIITLFHETGHGLHHLLTQVDEVGVSGINGVEWDAVELPSQFMENFVWEYDVLAQMSSHEETGAVLPKELFDKMHAAKNFQRGMFLVRQMEFALFDMEIYHQEDEGRLKEWPQILDKVRQEVAVTQPPAYNRFALSFSHIFAGGYSAGYYSYAWAEVLSADAYAAFEESDDVAETGRRFWKEILAVGGSRSAAESFKAFRGREPSLDALLRHSGFDNAA
ncbi:TPA: M3 family metallopeptidase [Neisseria subflava]|jgi:oligopeptidase A|uniref:M3 family metallopeptidase n=2 Tax=Neisseria TaxID=482 RepID=UPI0008A11025|nr:MULTISPECIES: M3 family metallopeptidase [unclassified Neisseria]OFK82120.1 oligopeptidase A [Neisseria sp. HMSC061E12]OFP80091.1 oligopeptidase A [Neisseria sp. HMSC066B07]OHO83874.1 oligopeptidase A [Neisseria sp. HMSC056A04]OHQ28623.1 oligopeptidase A [Neisseria sp. HMSC066F04]OHR16791.1 oligopeptidase A [Neisseria sp. HMSC078H04]